jgi:hypothetical protein
LGADNQHPKIKRFRSLRLAECGIDRAAPAVFLWVSYDRDRTVRSIESMEPVTLLLGLAAIVGTGALTKVGENITDAATQRFLDFLKRKAPDSATVQLLEAGESIDYGKAYLELKPISQEPEAIALLEAVKLEVEANPELAAKVEAELNGNSAQVSTVENWKGINIEGGTNDFRNSTFTF